METSWSEGDSRADAWEDSSLGTGDTGQARQEQQRGARAPGAQRSRRSVAEGAQQPWEGLRFRLKEGGTPGGFRAEEG